MENLYAILGWGSPIGTGFFLMSLGVMLYLLSRTDQITKEKKK